MSDFGRAPRPDVRVPNHTRVSQRSLVFVDRAVDAGPPDPSTDNVVLDATWTPEPGERGDLVPVRPALQSVIASVDLFDGTLARIDDWAAATNLADRFMMDGVTWWNRVRIIIRWDVHELILWRHVLDLLAPTGRYTRLIIPADRVALVAAARAGEGAPGAPIVVVAGNVRRRFGRVAWWRSWLRRHVRRSVLRRVRGAVDRMRVGPRRRGELTRRDAILDARLRALSSGSPDVLAIASARIFQVVRTEDGERFVDPTLAPVLDRLADEGCTVATLAVAIDHRNDGDWSRIEGDDRLLPQSMIERHYGQRGDDDIDAADVAARFADLPPVPFEIGDADLGPAVRTMIAGYSGIWLGGQRRWSMWAERVLRDLRPGVLFLDREDSRTFWLSAARRLGIPIVAIQHGIVYPNHPGYCMAPHPGLLLPEATCVFGSYERDVLVRLGPFPPEAVLTTGSPRANPETERGHAAPDERAAVRRELGVADGDRMLVVSVANNPVGGDIHSVCMVARTLGGPLPGVHVIVKLHPIDRTEGTYETLLGGMARAGGYPPPPVTVVRDIDLYRLLRAADAHLGQYSTVLTDAVVAGTPNMIAVGTGYDDHIGHEAARVAAPVRTVDDVREFMQDPRPADPEDRARFLAAHFEPGDATGRIGSALRHAITHPATGAERLNPRTLTFVNSREDAGPPDPSTDIVILDTAWTPRPGERGDLIPIRPPLRTVLDRVNLFDETLERLDAWAAEVGMADRLMVDGVSWWFHARSFVRLGLHEMMLWAHVLALLAPPGRYERIVMPTARTALIAAARAPRASSRSPMIETIGPPARRPSRMPLGSAAIVARLRRPGGRVLRQLGLPRTRTKRMAILDARLTTLAAQPGAVLAVVRAESFHIIHGADGERRGDPYVTPVLDELERRGHRVVIAGLALDFRREADWEVIEEDERLLPMSYLARRSPLPSNDRSVGAAAAARIAATPRVALDVDGFDLGPALHEVVTGLGSWFERQRHGMLWAELLMTKVQPSVQFTGWEAARTMWLGAARRLGVPSVAVQHGVIYPNNPDYYRPLHDGLVRPEVTCVYGSYERDLLVLGGRYDPAAVAVTGSPRVHPDEAPIPASPDERADVRRELDVKDDARLLVISGARNPVGDEIHSVSMVARLLDGPLPGVHVVVKQHPEEAGGEHYERLLTGLADAGGYAPPRVSIVRDMDLYRLLRAADAHLGLYSTVLTDAVLTRTPNMVAVGQAYADIIGYVDAGVAVPVRSVDEVRAFMADPRAPSPEDRARFLDQHYHRGDPTSRIADAISAQIAPPGIRVAT